MQADAGGGDDSASSRHVLPAGSKVGRYEVIRLIGEGGMGTVYEALDARLKRKVALKILSSELKSKRKAAKRFTIEAQAAARLEHPNVVGIFDFDVDCAIPYMAMEFLQGETLADAIDRGRLSFETMADIMLAVCAGVHAAHQAGIVHRDLKPSNIFLCADWQGNPTARVLDFGISKVGGVSSSGLTQTGDIVGTSQYLSPEQAAGLRYVTEQSDQYSLGVVMYECVTGKTPHHGQPIYTLLRNVAEGHHEPPRSLRPDLPRGLESIIDRAMRVNPQGRFPSVLDLGRAVFSFASPDVQRRFDDFYHRVDEPRWPGSPAWGTTEPAAATAAQRRRPVPTWQRRTTRTSSRARPRDRVVVRRDGHGPALSPWLLPALAAVLVIVAATVLWLVRR